MQTHFDHPVPVSYEAKFEATLTSSDTVVVCVSPRQPYGNGEIFQATFREMFKLSKEQGTSFCLILPHSLEGYNLQAVYNQASAETPLIQGITQQMYKDWMSINLESDSEICEMRKEMESAGKLKIMNWKEAETECAAELDSVLEDLTKRVQAGDSSYYEQTTALAHTFFQRAYEKEYATNASFQAACRQGKEYVTQIYWNYAHAESLVIGAWLKMGRKLAYANTFFQDHYDKGPNSNNTLFDCIKGIVCNPNHSSASEVALINIRITQHKDNACKPSRSERRKKSLDAEAAKNAEIIAKLKTERRKLLGDLGNNRTRLNELQATATKNISQRDDYIEALQEDRDVAYETIQEKNLITEEYRVTLEFLADYVAKTKAKDAMAIEDYHITLDYFVECITAEKAAKVQLERELESQKQFQAAGKNTWMRSLFSIWVPVVPQAFSNNSSRASTPELEPDTPDSEDPPAFSLPYWFGQ